MAPDMLMLLFQRQCCYNRYTALVVQRKQTPMKIIGLEQRKIDQEKCIFHCFDFLQFLRFRIPNDRCFHHQHTSTNTVQIQDSLLKRTKTQREVINETSLSNDLGLYGSTYRLNDIFACCYVTTIERHERKKKKLYHQDRACLLAERPLFL
jgi:hypothetical protein